MSRPIVVLIVVLIAIAAFVGYFVFNTPQKAPSAANPTTAKSAAPAPAPEQPSAVAPSREVSPTVAAEDKADVDEGPSGTLANSLVGLVVNDKNEPVAGARVQLSRDALMGEAIANQFFMGKESSGVPALSTVSDSKGAYAFRSIDPAKDYYLMATHPDYSQIQEEYVVVTRSGESRAPELVLRPGSTLRGNVADLDGNAVPNAKLHLDSAYMMGVEHASPDRLTVTTDNLGNYEFKNISQGARHLMCEADGYGVQIKSNVNFKGDATEIQQQDFRLQIGHPIAGRVFGPENEPIQGCKITAINYGGGNSSSRGEAESGEDGTFQIDGLEAGSYILMLDHRSYAQTRQNRVQADEVNVQIEMRRRAEITGHVFAAGKSDALTTFTCSLHRVNTSAGQPGTNQPLYETTNVREKFEGRGDGSFTLVGVDPGRYVIKFSAQGYAPRMSDEFTVVDGQPTPPINIGLSQGGSIRGRVTDSKGKPVAGVQVSSHDDEYAGAMFDDFIDGLVATRTTERKARTNVEGFFDLKQLNPGKYRVTLEHSSFTAENLTGLVVTEGKQTDAGSIALKSGGSVRGRVLDQAGKPLARGWVRIFSAATSQPYQARTDVEGRYLIEHVPPGTYTVSATRTAASGGDVFENLVEGQNSEQQITVFEGQETNRDLNLGS